MPGPLCPRPWEEEGRRGRVWEAGPSPGQPCHSLQERAFFVLYIYGLKRMVSRAVFRLACLNSLLTNGVYGSLRHIKLYFLGYQPTLALSHPSEGGRPFRVEGWLSPCFGGRPIWAGAGFRRSGANQTARHLGRTAGDGSPRYGSGLPCSLSGGRESGVNPLAAGHGVRPSAVGA